MTSRVSTTVNRAAEVILGRQRNPQSDSGPYMVPYLRAANVTDGTLDLSDVKSMNFTPSEQEVFALRPGDVLVSEGSGSIRTVGASAVWHEEFPGRVCFQNTLLRLRPRHSTTDSRFLAWWARAAFVNGLFASIATGANIYHLSAERVRSLPIKLPSLEDQRRIADFLDAETTRIDQLFTLRNVQLATLQARELSLIMTAFQEPAAKNRRSAPWVWLSSVPQDWLIGPVSGYFSTDLGRMLNPERATGENQAPYLRNANVHWYEISTDDVATMSFEPSETHRYSLKAGDLLVCEGGAGVAEAAVWDGRITRCYFQKSLHRVRQIRDVPAEWLMYWLRLAKSVGQFDAEGNLSTIPHLTGEQLRAMRLPIPPDSSVRVCALSEGIRALAAIRTTLRRANALLGERRQALITAAVTGQFDVTTGRGADLS